MSSIAIACVLGVAWFVLVFVLARRQQIDFSSKVSDIERALAVQQEAILELGRVSEDFSGTIETALRKIDADDGFASNELARSVDSLDEPSMEFGNLLDWWKIPPRRGETSRKVWTRPTVAKGISKLHRVVSSDPIGTFRISEDESKIFSESVWIVSGATKIGYTSGHQAIEARKVYASLGSTTPSVSSTLS